MLYKRLILVCIVFISVFLIGFSVAKADNPNEIFDDLSLGDLRGQDSWTGALGHDPQVVVASGTDYRVWFEENEYIQKNFGTISDEIVYYTLEDTNFVTGGNGFQFNFYESGVLKGLFWYYYYSSGFYAVDWWDDTGRTRIGIYNENYPIEFYFHIDTTNNRIGYASICTYGCDFNYLGTYTTDDTFNNIDTIYIDLANGLAQDVYIDDILTASTSDLSVDIVEPDFEQYDDEYEIQSDILLMFNSKQDCWIGDTCRVWVMWNEDNDGNIVYLMDEYGTELDSFEMESVAMREDWLTVPATTTSGYQYLDILVENLNGVYTADNQTVGWVWFRDLTVLWLTDNYEEVIDKWFAYDCDEICDDISTSTDPSWWDNTLYGLQCAGRKVTCWAFTPTASSTGYLQESITRMKSVFPFSMLDAMTKQVYIEDENGNLIMVKDSNATTTLNASGFFPAGTADIPVISNKMFDEASPYLVDIYTTIKGYITNVLYILLVVYLVLRIVNRYKDTSKNL